MPLTSPPPPIPPSFHTLKSRILTSLSAPNESYTDASPKGTLDTAIVPLIERLSKLDGVVSTSSCAGRVSVFLEGRKNKEECTENATGNREVADDEERGGRVEKRSVPGGKGLGGRWLFVSHEPLAIPPDDANAKDEEASGDGLMKLFGLSRHDAAKRNEDRGARRSNDTKNARFARFAFEPMILHIATASLSHAAPILSAAISAGFRESGVQSLKNLTDLNAVSMVAVRSAGLAFESVIGIVRDRSVLLGGGSGNGEDGQGQEEVVEALVNEEYLEMLVGIANERFEANTERIGRFESVLFADAGKKISNDWEDKEKRQERKRAEGLKRREELKMKHNLRDSVDGDSDDPDLGLFEGIT
ncbi:MAG: hypothetical protein Q9221_006077 [Calogaya cf. arnoldii]